MDPINNPFSPGAGAPPPELVGRDPLLEQARILLGRVKQKRPEKSLLLTGLRGVGKTVLLNEIERMAKTAGYQSILLKGAWPDGSVWGVTSIWLIGMALVLDGLIKRSRDELVDWL